MARYVTLAAAQPLRRRPNYGEPPMTVEENLRQAVDLVKRAPKGTDLICFPEHKHARVLALAGAEILLHPTRISNAPSEKAFEALCLARAVENVCWFVASSFCPPPPFTYGSWQAPSFVADPVGTILAEVGREPGICAATLDLDSRRRRPEGYLWETFRELRRPDLYGALSRRQAKQPC
jgi:predicted amidohydrolase